MVRDRALKAAIRKEMERTGEPYNVVLRRFEKAQAQLMGADAARDCSCEPRWTGEAPAEPDRHCDLHGEGT